MAKANKAQKEQKQKEKEAELKKLQEEAKDLEIELEGNETASKLKKLIKERKNEIEENAIDADDVEDEDLEDDFDEDEDEEYEEEKEDEEIIMIEFKKSSTPYIKGDVAGVKKSIAKQYCKSGVAQRV